MTASSTGVITISTDVDINDVGAVATLAIVGSVVFACNKKSFHTSNNKQVAYKASNP